MKNKKLHIHNENKVKVVIHNSHPKRRKRRSRKKTDTRTLGNPIQGQMQPIIINQAPSRDESQNELNRMAHNYIQPDLRNTLLLRNEPEPQQEFFDNNKLVPKRNYNKVIHSVKSQLGFPDNDSFAYLNKFKTLKSLKEHIKKTNPEIPDSLLKSVNGKNKENKIREYLKFREVNGGGPIIKQEPLIKIKLKNKQMD